MLESACAGTLVRLDTPSLSIDQRDDAEQGNMPLSVFVLLDILLLMLVALFIPIGFWRGAQREVLVTLGILFGAVLADWWARPWGRELAEMTQLREDGGAFLISMLFLLGSTFFLGYAAGGAFPFPRPGLIMRLFGALIAAANAALLLSFALRDIRIFLLQNQDTNFLNQAMVARFLSTNIGWLLLGAAVVFVPIVLALVLFGRNNMIEDYDEDLDEEYDDHYIRERRPFPPRAPGSPGGYGGPPYKTDPPRSNYYSPAEETRPIAARGAHGSAEDLGGEYRPINAEETEEHTVILRPHADELERIDRSQTANSERTMQFTPQSDEKSDSTIPDGRCPNCRADIRDAEMYCPRCGRVL